MGEEAEKHLLSLGEACERLGLPPRTLRNIVEEYKDVPGIIPEEEGRLSEEGVRTLERIIEWRSAGLGPEEIGRLLEEMVPAQAPPDSPLVSDRFLARMPSYKEKVLMEQSLPDRLECLARTIQRSESKRLEDRDLLLSALMRLQQEVRMLRYELRGGTRRERRGFLGRLFRRK